MQIILLTLRKKAKATQEDMADLLGISVQSYRRKEHGGSEFTQDEMFKLSGYFNKSISDIFLPRDYQIGTFSIKNEE